MARTKIPYFPFFPKDYLSDLAVRGLNAEQRGCLIDLFCWMALSPVYGALYEGDEPIPKERVITELIQPDLSEPKTRDRAGFILETLLFKRLIRKGLNGAFYNQRLLFYLTPKEKFELKGAALSQYLTAVKKIAPGEEIPEYLITRLGDGRLKPSQPTAKSPKLETQPPAGENKKILNAEIEAAKIIYRRVFSKTIEPGQIGLLAFGRNGSRKNAWGSIPVLIEFWKSCEGQDIKDPMGWSLKCGEDPQTVARFEKLAYTEPAGKRGGDFEQLF